MSSKPLKKVKMSPQLTPGFVESELVVEVLRQNYNRLAVKERVLDAGDNPELVDVLSRLVPFCVHELYLKVRNWRCYLIVLKGPGNSDELKALPRGSEVGLYGQFEECRRSDGGFLYFVVNCPGSPNLMILSPELHFRVTSLTDSLPPCVRRHSLNQRYYPKGRVVEKHGVLGSMKHVLFQRVLMGEAGLDLKALCEEQIVKEGDFFQTGLQSDLEQQMEALRTLVGKATEFRQKYLVEGVRLQGPEGESAVIEKVVAAEFSVSSYKFSVKGKIDLLLKVRHFGKAERTKIIPFELKTGKEKPEYADQVLLYNVCFNDCYADGFSLVYYTETDKFVWVRNSFDRLAALIRKRNDTALRMRRDPLPRPIDSEFTCKNFCSQNVNCAFKAFEESAAAAPDIEDLRRERIPLFMEHYFQSSRGMVAADTLQYVRSVEAAIAAEERLFLSDRSLSPGTPVAFLFSGFFMRYKAYQEGADAGRLVNFDLYFRPEDRPGVLDYLEGLALNSEVVFSSKFNPDFKVEGRIVNYCCEDLVRLANFKVTFELRSEEQLKAIFALIDPQPDFVERYSREWTVSRPDKNDFVKLRTNLLHAVTSPESVWIVQNVVNATNAFRAVSREALIGRAATFNPRLKPLQERFNLNHDQAAAVSLALQTPDFALVLGFTGAGKKTVAAALIAEIIDQGKKVLFCGSERGAERLLRAFAAVASQAQKERLLSLVKLTDASLRTSFDELRPEDLAGLKSYQSRVNRSAFISSVSANDRLKFRDASFDFVIVDECQNLPEGTLLRNLCYGRRLVLLGDFFVSPAADSLFERLCRTYAERVVALTAQFRMNRQLTALCNELFYKGSLKVANEEVGSQALHIAHSPLQGQKQWLREALISGSEAAAMFLDTSVAGPETETIDLVEEGQALGGAEETPPVHLEHQSTDELQRNVYAVRTLLEALFRGGVDAREVGVVFNSAHLSERLKGLRSQFRNFVQMDQAGDFECSVIVLALHCGPKATVALEGSFERLWVALTRAKAKLIVVGAASQLRRFPRILRLIRLLNEGQRLTSVNRSETEEFLAGEALK